MNQIEIYLKTNTNYEMNGDITLTPISCIYKNSEYLVTLEHPIDEMGRWKYIDYENVLSVEDGGKRRLYRIFNIVKSLYSITAYARPLFFDLIDDVLLDVRPTNKTGQEALDIILKDTPFSGHSNIIGVNTSYYVTKNIVEAILGDDENSFLNRWGGEVLLDNFDIYINDKIGSDNGVRVEFGYNINEIEEDINIEEVATRIIPTGYNGIMLDGSTPWVDSPLINKYTKPKMRVINFDDVKIKESETDEEGFNTIEEARAELIKRCNKLYEEGIDKPSVNYKIDMINLANTTAYKDYIDLVTVSEGDTVTCYIPGLDIDVKARVIDFEEDLMIGEYISLELGNIKESFFNKQADLQSKVENILNSNGTVNSDMLSGTINALQVQFKALRDIAQKQHVRAILFEDRDSKSPTFGCMCIGTMGFEIASEFKHGTKEWDFRTFGTGKGFFADCIIAGVLKTVLLESINGNFRLDLSTDGAAKFFNDGELALSISNNQIQLYNWKKNNDFIGSLAALVRNNDANQPLIGLYNDKDSATMIGYQGSGDNSVPAYVYFDKYDVLKFKELFGKKYPIQFLEDAFFNSVGINKIVTNSIGFNSQNDSSIYESTSKHLILNRNTHCTGNITASNIPRMANDRIENIELKLMQEEGII